MQKFAFIGDTHIQDGPRLEDTMAALGEAAQAAREEGVCLFLHGGDLFERRTTATEREAADQFVAQATDIAPLVICRGNHDAPLEIARLGRIRTRHAVVALEHADVITAEGAKIAVVPHFDRSNAAAYLQGLGIDAQDQAASAMVRSLCLYFASQFRGFAGPKILMGHLSISGARLSSGEGLPEHGIQVNAADVYSAGADIAVCNHIHATQEVAPGIHYPGSITRHDWGEAHEEKGWLLVVSDSSGIRAEFRPVSQRPWITLDWIAGQEDESIVSAPPSANIRVRITANEDQSALASQLQCVAHERFGRCHSLKVETKILPVDRIRAPEIVSAITPKEKLEAYWSATQRPIDADAIQADLAAITREAAL